jgi:hypothetical protein
MNTTFEAPVVIDYGTLAELTEATGFTAAEDGGSKILIHHVTPSSPLGP